MKRILCLAVLLVSLPGIVEIVVASSTLPISTGNLVDFSDAVFRGTVRHMDCYKAADGLIYTRTSLRVEEAFKGKFPAALLVVHRGGEVDGENDFSGLSPRFVPNGEYLLFVRRRLDGRLECTQGQASAVRLLQVVGSGTEYASPGGELLNEIRQLAKQGVISGGDVTDQAGNESPQVVTGMLQGIASRFLQPDRGEPIPYLIDATSLPAGINLTQATNAVQQAMNAWMAVTSLKFKLVGIQSFGQGADTLADSGEKIFIQLHDNYNRINSANVLGIGGRVSGSSTVPGAGWDIGGNIAGNEFRKTTFGYVVLESGASSMQNLTTFTEVLCHELGHALSLAHSSVVVTSDPYLTNAIMYFRAHADGRGATLGAYDPPIIRQAYPSNNTAPYTYTRMLDVTSAASAPTVAGINEVQLRGYDLQTANLTLLSTNASANSGTFSLVGSTVKYAPSEYWGDSGRLDPADTLSYDVFYARYSDGTNASPYAQVRVLSFNADADSPSDGIPDHWMLQYFGHFDPQAGDKSRASDDADSDGVTNLNEYRAGMSPTSASSAQKITLINSANIQWQAKAYEVYEVFGSTNLATWTRVGNLVQPTTSIGSASISFTNPTRQFFRILKVP